MIYAITSFYDVTDYDAYWEYGQEAKGIVESFGGRFMVASHNTFEITAFEGKKPDIINILVFGSKDKYLAFYNSPEYQKLIFDRNKVCNAQVLILEKSK